MTMPKDSGTIPIMKDSDSLTYNDFEFQLQREYKKGKKKFAGLDLPFESYAKKVFSLVCGRLEQGQIPKSKERILEVLELTACMDLYLTIACENGIPGAWEAFMQYYIPKLRSIAVHQKCPSGSAEELALNTAGDLFQPPPQGGARTRLGTYDGSGSLSAWLAVIVKRRIIDSFREQKTVSTDNGSFELSSNITESYPTGTSPNPAILFISKEAGGIFKEVLQESWIKLTSREALVIILKYRENLPQKEIARLLKVGEPRLSRILKKAVEKIREAVHRGFHQHFPDNKWDTNQLWNALKAAVEDHLATFPTPPDSTID